jgi:hypothetical protein
MGPVEVVVVLLAPTLVVIGLWLYMARLAMQRAKNRGRSAALWSLMVVMMGPLALLLLTLLPAVVKKQPGPGEDGGIEARSFERTAEEASFDRCQRPRGRR